MTLKEKAIATAYTSISFVKGDELGAFYRYADELMGAPLVTFDFANEKLWDELHERSKDDFVRMCAGEFEHDR